jgi:tetratricopeptide (TPR) repeat protein
MLTFKMILIMKYYYIILALSIALLASGCQNFVDIKTQGSLVPGETENYRYLLNNTSEWEKGPTVVDIASDDVQLVDGTPQISDLLSSEYYAYWYKSYTWQAVIYPLGGYYQTDYDWNAMYNTISYANAVIDEVPSSTGGTDEEKEELIAEALVHRADAYLMLVNMYAKPYNSTTADTDLGLPLVLELDTEKSLKRASIQAIYDQIITDLTEALPSLPETQNYTTLPTKASAYAELARAYLLMGQYEKANSYADSALVYKNTLNDLSQITSLSSNNYPIRINDPEILLSKIADGGISAYSTTALRLSDDLLALLGTKDKRYTLFTAGAESINASYAAGRYFYKDKALYESRNIGPSVPEMILIKAEYYARSGDTSNAMVWVNKLRKKRFAPEDYEPLTAANTDDALIKVIEERHREFFCRMLRWWDMRRLKDDSRFQETITRKFNGTTYTLAPTSNRYVFCIAEYQIKLNPEIQQNPE